MWLFPVKLKGGRKRQFLAEKSQILVTLFFPLFLAHFFPLVMLTTFFDNGFRIT